MRSLTCTFYMQVFFQNKRLLLLISQCMQPLILSAVTVDTGLHHPLLSQCMQPLILYAVIDTGLHHPLISQCMQPLIQSGVIDIGLHHPLSCQHGLKVIINRLFPTVRIIICFQCYKFTSKAVLDRISICFQCNYSQFNKLY